MGKPARLTLVERRAEELRLSIAHTAAEIFVADGDTSATIERIAEAAGISTRTFYRHFPVKEDVVRPLFKESSDAIIATLRRAETGGDPVSGLVAAFTSPLADGTFTDFEWRLMRLLTSVPEYRLRWMVADDELCDAVAEFLSGRIAAHERPMGLSLPAYLTVQATRHVYDYWITSGSGEDLTDLLRDALQVVLAGFMRPSAADA